MFESLFSKYPFFRYIPAILGMALIFRSSAITGSGMTWLEAPWDKLLHSCVYACLGLAFSLWSSRAKWERKWWKAFLLAWGLAVLYGASDEIHQSFVPGRSAGIDDWIFDCFGSFVGVTLYCVYVKLGKKKFR